MGAEGQGDYVIVFVFRVLNALEGHGDIPVAAAILTRGFPSRLHGQETSLGQRDIANGLTLTGEVELFLFLALVFGHGGIIEVEGDADQSNEKQ
ncbi:MAG TPA: hypothetical protein EYN66_13530 [Myxococcales bacterium]|nr:hypothetical protein [Myxococcales bacterium]